MAPFRGSLKQSLTSTYLAGTEALTHHLLRGHSGERDFHRVIVVAALGRGNGIASGARLQWNSLRRLGVDVELLDVTPSLRNPLFRMPHRPGSAYVFHSGGPQTANLIGSDIGWCEQGNPQRLVHRIHRKIDGQVRVRWRRPRNVDGLVKYQLRTAIRSTRR